MHDSVCLQALVTAYTEKLLARTTHVYNTVTQTDYYYINVYYTVTITPLYKPCENSAQGGKKNHNHMQAAKQRTTHIHTQEYTDSSIPIPWLPLPKVLPAKTDAATAQTHEAKHTQNYFSPQTNPISQSNETNFPSLHLEHTDERTVTYTKTHTKLTSF